MSATPESSGTSRRRFLALSAMLGAGALAAACGGAPASPTAAPKAAEPTKPAAPAATTAPAGATPTTAPAAKPAEPTKPAAEPTKPAAAPAGAAPAQKPRNRTLFLMWSGREGKYVDHELWNGYAVGANHQNGLGILHEPVAYYSAFADKEILWLAESYKYSPDFKELTIKTRSGITWSDGTPFSANDVAFTLEGLKRQGAKVRWGNDVQLYVDSATATDANTVLVKFKVPAPRFFRFLTYKFDIGVYIIPKHIFEKEDDWSKFQNFDLAKGLPLTTGPWKVVFASPDQKVIDRRDDWWAVKAGLAQLPKVERIVYLPFAQETSTAQALITNQVDCSLDLRPNTMKTVLAQNPKIITHVGKDVPYGYVDWWPTSLYLNNEKEPWNDKDVRWAISYFIDRKQVVEVGYGGAGTISKLPMPTYKPLLPYFDVVKDLLEKYDTTKFDPAAGNEILTKKGWKKEGNLYKDAKGNPVKLEIGGFNIFNDIGPVITEQLKRQGIDATYITPPDMFDRFSKGEYSGMLFGHGGSVSDPYDTLRLYQSASAALPGSHAVNFSRWKNADYDKIVDQVYTTPMDDQKKLLDLFRQAMQVWLPELPDVQITEWYHRIPMNTTYWTGWPTKDDPYVNGAFWHLTFQLILNRLTPTQ
jgi:peptide/nickel transport system substrate-binding protein